MSNETRDLAVPGLGEFIDWAWELKQERDALRAEVEALRKDAAAGAVVWKFIDRMADPAECDPADVILAEFVAAFGAAMAAKEGV